MGGNYGDPESSQFKKYAVTQNMHWELGGVTGKTFIKNPAVIHIVKKVDVELDCSLENLHFYSRSF